MKDTHFSLALRLFPIVVEARRKNHRPTYKIAAAKVGRNPDRDYRLIAAGCDLIDAASALSGLPLLALTTVLDTHNKINPNAFNRDPLQRRYRDHIISNSSGYIFSDDDFTVIRKRLSSLHGKTRSTAWDLVYGRAEREATYGRLAPAPPSDDPINDLEPPAPVTHTSLVTSYGRNRQVRDSVIARANGYCEYCGERAFIKSDGEFYLESHHIIKLADQGADTMQNVIALCPNDHRQAHYGKDSKEVEAKMIKIVARLANHE